MKRIFFVIGLGLIINACSLKPTLRGNFTDKRDGQEYKWVKLGNQIWMAQNLDYKSNYSWYSYDDTSNHKIYGLYYNINEAKNVCPIGWHLPSDGEWEILEVKAGMSKSDADHDRWRGAIASDFIHGGSTEFDILFNYSQKQNQSQFWTSTNIDKPTYTRLFKEGESRICKNLLESAHDCYVRCLKNDTTTNDLKVIKK
jgi:uncharacterized protein (TIGR02145 family)